MKQHEAELQQVLETTQFSSAVKARLPRRKLGRGTLTLLILLRIYVLVAIPLVAYAFIRALAGS